MPSTAEEHAAVMGSLTLKTEAARTFEMLGIADPMTHQHVPQDLRVLSSTAVKSSNFAVQNVVEDQACALLHHQTCLMLFN